MDLITNVMGSTPSPLRSWQPKSDKVASLSVRTAIMTQVSANHYFQRNVCHKVSQARVSLEEDSRVKKAKSAKTVGFFHKPIYNPNPEIDTLDNSSNASLGTSSLASKEAAEGTTTQYCIGQRTWPGFGCPHKGEKAAGLSNRSAEA